MMKKEFEDTCKKLLERIRESEDPLESKKWAETYQIVADTALVVNKLDTATEQDDD